MDTWYRSSTFSIIKSTKTKYKPNDASQQSQVVTNKLVKYIMKLTMREVVNNYKLINGLIFNK